MDCIGALFSSWRGRGEASGGGNLFPDVFNQKLMKSKGTKVLSSRLNRYKASIVYEPRWMNVDLHLFEVHFCEFLIEVISSSTQLSSPKEYLSFYYCTSYSLRNMWFCICCFWSTNDIRILLRAYFCCGWGFSLLS